MEGNSKYSQGMMALLIAIVYILTAMTYLLATLVAQSVKEHTKGRVQQALTSQWSLVREAEGHLKANGLSISLRKFGDE